MSKEQMIMLIEGRINTIQSLMIECIELIYNGAYNEAIETAAKLIERDEVFSPAANEIRRLKK